jgi:hypothetical protein
VFILYEFGNQDLVPELDEFGERRDDGVGHGAVSSTTIRDG